MGGNLSSEQAPVPLDECNKRVALKYGLPTDAVEYASAMQDALRHGWHLDHQLTGWPQLAPPDHFQCRGNTAVWIRVEYQGAMVAVPDYVLDADVRHTGMRASERTRLTTGVLGKNYCVTNAK